MLVIAGLSGLTFPLVVVKIFDEAMSGFWGIVMSLVWKFKADKYNFPSESFRDKEGVMHIFDFQ